MIRSLRIVVVALFVFATMPASADEAQCLTLVNERGARCKQLAADQEPDAELKKKLEAATQAAVTVGQELAAKDAALAEAKARLAADNTEPNRRLVGQLEQDRSVILLRVSTAQATLEDAQRAVDKATADVGTAQNSYATLNCEGFPQNSSGEPFTKGQACDVLATYLETLGAEVAAPSERVVTEVKLAGNLEAQPDRQTANNKSGTVAQIEPVETTKPINLFGGALAVAGAEVGTLGAATISLNPWALASPDDVVAQRLTDISVTVPFELGSTDTSHLEFVALRVRVNATALTNTGELEAALEDYAKAAGKYADDLQAVLQQSSDVAACVAAVERTHKVTSDNCGQDLDGSHLDGMRARSYEALRSARRAADRYYLGLDVRADFGDPTGDAILGDDGTRLVGGLGGGLRIPLGSRWDWELRGRAAGDYFKSSDDNPVADTGLDPAYAFDWGAAMLLTGSPDTGIDKQRLQLGVGVEGKHSGDIDEAVAAFVATNYVDLNLMAVVPTATGSDLGIKVRLPLVEGEVDRDVLISVAGDFGLLAKGTQ